MRAKPVSARLTQHTTLSPIPHRRLRTISETAAVPAPDSDWSVVGRRSGGRVRTVSGASSQSCDSLPAALGAADLQEFDWQAWSSQQEVPDDEQLDEQWDCVSNVDTCTK